MYIPLYVRMKILCNNIKARISHCAFTKYNLNQLEDNKTIVGVIDYLDEPIVMIQSDESCCLLNGIDMPCCTYVDVTPSDKPCILVNYKFFTEFEPDEQEFLIFFNVWRYKNKLANKYKWWEVSRPVEDYCKAHKELSPLKGTVDIRDLAKKTLRYIDKYNGGRSTITINKTVLLYFLHITRKQ